MEDLGSIVRQARKALGISQRTAADRAVEAGGQIDHSTISKIETGKAVAPDRRTLEALSVALDVPLERMEKAVGVEALGRPFILPDYASRLSLAEREAVRNLVRVMAESKTGKTGDEGADSTPAIAADDNERHLYAVPEKIPAFIAEERGVDGIGMDDLPEDP